MVDSTEATHILISVVTLSLAFSMSAAFVGLPEFMVNFPIVLLTLGFGFIMHELAHRQVARSKGFYSVYRAWIPGLAIALGLAVMTRGSLIFAAPGAVYYMSRGPVTPRDSGQIGIAGALMNMGIGMLFFLMALFNPGTILEVIGATGAWINFFLAFFNLLPIPPLDGYSVIQWSVPIWGAAFGAAFLFTFISPGVLVGLLASII